MGATLAIHDAVTLANWISTLELATVDDLERVFRNYHTERYPAAKEAFKSGQMFTRNFGKVCSAQET
jgi:2-polyprenyl-6-methoxyphenol hydroxylase-like FAD-dependent oxidoreductase